MDLFNGINSLYTQFSGLAVVASGEPVTSVTPIAIGAASAVANTAVNAVTYAYKAGIDQVFQTFVLDDRAGKSIFAAIITPCKMIAAGSFLYSMFPLLKSDINHLKHKATDILFTFILVLMFLNGGAFGRAVGVGNYAVINGINKSIGDQLTALAGLEVQARNMDTDRDSMVQITAKLNQCLAMQRTQGDGTPNPLFTTCEQEARTQIQTANITNSITKNNVLASLTNGDLGVVADNVVKAGIGLPGWIGQQIGQKAMDLAMAVPQAIFDAWKTIVSMLTRISFALALSVMPIPLALSILYSAPLQAWFTGLWSLGIFQWLLTILSGAFLVMSSKLGGSIPMFFSEMAVAIAAPLVAAGLAAGGAFGVFKLFEQAAQTATSIVTKVVAAV